MGSWDKGKKKDSLEFAHVVVLLYVYSCGSDGVKQCDVVSYLKLAFADVLSRGRFVTLLVERGLISRFTVSGRIRLFVSSDGSIYAQKLLKEIKGFY